MLSRGGDVNGWKCVYELNRSREVVAGSATDLASAVSRGADLRIYTTFDWVDHMGTEHPDQGVVEETIDLRVAYLLGDDRIAALTPLRYPADAGLGFGKEPSLSFYMYNQDGQFGIARPYFRAAERHGDPRPRPDFGPHYHVLDWHDAATPSPSHNAVYDFNCYRWLVRDDWREVLAHDEAGEVIDGSLDALVDAFRAGCSVKVAVRDLCSDLAEPGRPPVRHEVFVELGSMYYHRERGFHSGESLPLVRIAPAVPLRYAPSNWTFGWVLARTDGRMFHLNVDPYTREISRTSDRYAARWFVR
jgi:hypothetical protein